MTNHHPLVKLLGGRALTDMVNPRFFCLKEKTLQYKIVIKYLPGKRNSAAAFLSRYPALRTPPDTEDTDQEVDLIAVMTMEAVVALSQEAGITMDKDVVLDVASEDPVYHLPVARVLAGDWHPQTGVSMFMPILQHLGQLSNGLCPTYTYEQGCV